MEQIEISVVIPVYKGKRYLSYLLSILFDNFSSDSYVQNEVIFVNDCSDEILEVEAYWKNRMNIQIANLPENRGIHNARITGLSMARGNYILFLDQDDQIKENYIISQRMNIGDGDAVLCNGYIVRHCVDGKKIIYSNIISQKKATVLAELIHQGNCIISPGQVLIKKSSIPDLWTKAAMTQNGADDYLLWLLMLSEGKKININADKLYTHIGHGSNSSQNVIEMQESLKEVIYLLKDNHVLQQSQLAIMKNRVDNLLERNKFLGMIAIYDQWMYLRLRNQKIAEYLLKQEIKKIAVYGMSYIGNRLYDELKNSGINIVFGIDKDADKILYEIPVLKPDDTQLRKYIQEVDMIVVTAVAFYQEIKKELERSYQIKIVSMNDILMDMIRCN